MQTGAPFEAPLFHFGRYGAINGLLELRAPAINGDYAFVSAHISRINRRCYRTHAIPVLS